MTATKYDYDFFLFSQLTIANYFTEIQDMEYDLMFGEIISLYEDFIESSFNDDNKSLYE
jgi:hypothetical protein